MSKSEGHIPLLTGVSQFEVDFVIPRVGVDIPLGIDPFLLYKSRDSSLSALHAALLRAFNSAIEVLRTGDQAGAKYLLTFPEVSEIGLGYAKKGKRGSGVGEFLSRLILETLADSPALLERGVRHVEELQLVSLGIGPDRTSDIVANLIKGFLIEYTRKQCELWNIPLQSGVPINHIFDLERLDWYDDYVDLPVSPLDGSPIILVPRRIVRALPWINYDDYFRMEFTAYLRTKRVKNKFRAKKQPRATQHLNKNKIVSITRHEIGRIDSYIDKKERAAEQAQPSIDYLDESARCPEAEKLKQRLSKIEPGTADATKYQRIILEILNYLFNPELINGELEVRTSEGTERRDILFTNDSDKTFWSYVRAEHSCFLLMFEIKNTDRIEINHLNQTATYLGDRLGYLGFIVSRNPISQNQQRKTFSIYNDSNPRKLILVLSDEDIRAMLDMKCLGREPMRFIQAAYRKFRQSVQ